MNEKPHTHSPKLEKSYNRDRWEVVYGDTRVKVRWSWFSYPKAPSAKRVKKALAKAVRLHDEGSREAGRQEERLLAAQAAVTLPVTNGAWGGDILSGKVVLEDAPPGETDEEQRKRHLEELRKSKEEADRQRRISEANYARQRQEAIFAARAEHWKQGTPEKKVEVDQWGNVVADIIGGYGTSEHPFVQVVGNGERVYD